MRVKYRENPAAYRRQYLASHPEKRQKANLLTSQRDERNKQLLYQLKERPCMDCGGWFNPWQMDFDHRDASTKVKNVSWLRSHKTILQEIKKCDLVCANCHRNRTYQRISSKKADHVRS